MEPHYYLDFNPSGPGYVVGVAHGANAVVKLFKTDDPNYSGWLIFGAKKTAMHLVDQIKAKHPSVKFYDETVGIPLKM